MKIVCLLGSPRLQGNSATLAIRFMERAKARGADCAIFALNRLRYRGCQACYACKTKSEKCILEDDLAEVLDAVATADVLVLASPTYYGEVSSQLKAFIDRTFSYLVPDYTTNPNPSRLLPGKKAVMVLCQGHPDEKIFADIFPRYSFFLKWYGFAESHLIRCCGVGDAGEVNGRTEILQLVDETVDKVLQTTAGNP